MRVLMTTTISGTFDGRDYPPAGQALDTSDVHGADLCAAGLAVPVPDEPETATAPPAETRRRGRR